MKSDYLIISCSLNPESNSRKMSKAVFEIIDSKVGAEFIDLRDVELPLCDGGKAYGHPNVSIMSEKISKAKCILLGVPIYNYDVNAAAKNLIELTGRAWTEKLVGFMCAAGGKSSYMSVMAVANSLMLDFRSVIIPRFVYTEGSSFDALTVTDEKLTLRLAELADTALHMSALVKV